MTNPKTLELFCICIVMTCLILMALPATAQTIVPPVVITSPGTYEITADLQSIKDQTAITIESSDVTINGNGCYIGGIGREKSIGILVNKRGDYLTNITISRVKLHDWGTALAFRYVKGEKGDTNVITKNVILNSATGIEIDACNYITLASNEISECDTGIKISGNSNNIDLFKNTVDKNGYGIDIIDTSQVLLKENLATNSETYGIQISSATDANLTRNSASNNQYSGIRLVNVNDFQIVSNDVSGSLKGGGIELGTGVSNGIVYDNYLRNRQNVEVKTVAEDILWNVEKQPGTNIVAGPYFAGNFWGADDEEEGFSQYTPDTEGWGICDDPYQINTIQIDYLPLHYTDKRVAPETLEESQPAEELTNTTGVETIPINGTTTEDNATAELPDNQIVTPPPSSDTGEQVEEEPEIVSEETAGSSQQPDTIPNTSVSQEKDYQTVAVTNSYGDGGAVTDTLTTTDISKDTKTNGENITTSPVPETTPPLIAYGKYSIRGPEDAAVFFVTDNNVKVFIGRITDGTLDFTVPLDGIKFVSYVIEREDIDSITGTITEFPKENETIIIELSTGETGSEENTTFEQADNQTGTQSISFETDHEIPESSEVTEETSEEEDYHEIVVTNAYGDGSVTSDTPPDDNLPVETRIPEINTTVTPNQDTKPRQYTTGYYSIHGPDEAAVFFVTDGGVKVFMGRINNSTLDFPVPVNGISYTSYIIEGDGFDSVTGGISEFPKTGETIVIDVSEEVASGVSTTSTTDTNVTGGNIEVYSDEEPVETVTVLVTPENGGTIVPGGEVEVRKGEGITFTITPDEGYTTTYLLFDGVKIGAESTFTLEELDTDHTFSASFEEIP